MARYRWTWSIEVDAQDELEAASRIEEAIEEAFHDPDGVISHGELKPIKRRRGKGGEKDARANG